MNLCEHEDFGALLVATAQARSLNEQFVEKDYYVTTVLRRRGYRDDPERWPEIHDPMIDAMIRLEKALKPYLERLKID